MRHRHPESGSRGLIACLDRLPAALLAASLALVVLPVACARSPTAAQTESAAESTQEAKSQPEAGGEGTTAATDPAETETKDEKAEETPEAKKRRERKQRRRILLKTAYDDRSVGAEQTPLVEAEMGIYEDPELERYVRSVAVRLLRYAPRQPFEYEFRIVDQTVPNAFALPGGKIYVSRGLLALVGSEDELAAVLGHEITHAAERHAAARIEHASRINPLSIGYMRAASIAAYGREHERDADRGGQILAAQAGYDPNAIATFLRKLDAFERYEVGWSRLPSFLATHPTSPERSAIAAQRSAELVWTPAPSVASQSGEDRTYKDMIDGLVLGDDPAGGLFDEGRFVHPDMGFSLRFPPGWKTHNEPQSVSAIAPAGDAEASLSAAGPAGNLEETVDDFLSQEINGVQFRVLDRRPFKIGELPAIRVDGRAPGLHAVMAFVEYGEVTFRLSMLSLAGAESKYRGRANAFLQSFRPLDEAGTYSLEVTRLRVARALANETLAQLSTRTRNDLEIVYTGVLNDVFPETQLKKGQTIKIGLSEPYFPKPREEPQAAESGDAEALPSTGTAPEAPTPDS